jgi:hypothetical protein
MKCQLVYLLIFCTIPIDTLISQNPNKQTITYHHRFGTEILQLNTSYYFINNSDSIQFENLKYYISQIEFLKDNKIIWNEEQSYHLLDVATPESCRLSFNIPSSLDFNQLRFCLGIDSITNNSGALGGDLDPTRGMYWTWQSGYINIKIEGKSNLCQTRNHEFQFHLGGYQYPFNSLQTILLNVSDHEPMNVEFDLKQFFKSIDLSKNNHIMSPGLDAVMLSEKISKYFSIEQP